MNKLKTLLQFRYRYIYLSAGLTTLILSLSNLYYLTLLIPFAIYIWIKQRDMAVFIICVLMIYTFSFIIQTTISLKPQEEYKLTVIEVSHTEKTTVIGEIKGVKVIVYFKDKQTNITPGDLIVLKGDLEKPINNTIPNTFNYREYLMSKKIQSQIYVKKLLKHQEKLSIYDLSYSIERYIDSYHTYSKRYVKTFILADKSEFTDDFLNHTTQLGISHLFAVSGLHVGILIMAITFIYKKFRSDERTSIIIIPILIIYMIITSFSPSIVRAGFLYIGLVINKKCNIDFNTLDILSIIYILLLFWNPFYIYNPGFVLSFLVTFTILLCPFLINEKSENNQIIIITIISFLSTIPVILRLNNEINMYTLFINIIMIYYMTIIILPLSYITFILPVFDYILHLLSVPFEHLIKVSSSIQFFTLQFSFLNPIQMIIYYTLLITFLIHPKKYKRNGLVFLAFLFITYNISLFNPVKSVTMIDIHGDSFLIQDSFNKCNILVDTGISDEYDSVINFLKSKNIRSIDLLIITHFHSDHMGEMNDVLLHFDVDRIITEDNKDYKCGSLYLDFHEKMTSYENPNNDSLVFTLHISNKKYLFTGDIEEEREDEFIEHYSVDVDYLKSPHHGSNSSSTKPFLNSITTENVLISCYRNNHHGHPHLDVIKMYEEQGMNIYRTDVLGTVEIKYFFSYEWKKYHPPN